MRERTISDRIISGTSLSLTRECTPCMHSNDLVAQFRTKYRKRKLHSVASLLIVIEFNHRHAGEHAGSIVPISRLVKPINDTNIVKYICRSQISSSNESNFSRGFTLPYVRFINLRFVWTRILSSISIIIIICMKKYNNIILNMARGIFKIFFIIIFLIISLDILTS